MLSAIITFILGLMGFHKTNADQSAGAAKQQAEDVTATNAALMRENAAATNTDNTRAALEENLTHGDF